MDKYPHQSLNLWFVRAFAEYLLRINCCYRGTLASKKPFEMLKKAIVSLALVMLFCDIITVTTQYIGATLRKPAATAAKTGVNIRYCIKVSRKRCSSNEYRKIAGDVWLVTNDRENLREFRIEIEPGQEFTLAVMMQRHLSSWYP